MSIRFFWGDEDFLIEEAINNVKKEILNNDINELNYKVVDNPSFPCFSETIRTNAMMFGDIVIVIKCKEYFLASKNKAEINEKQVQELIDGFKNVSEKVHLILVCQTPRGEKKKPDSRKKLYKELSKIAEIKEFPSYRNYEDYKLIPIIKKMASKIDIEIQNSECSYLVQTTGSALRDIYNQLEKLKLFAYPNKKITKNMIDEIATNAIDIFSISDLILKKEYVKALKLLSDILQKEHYLPSFALIQKTFSTLVKLKIYSNKLSSYDLAVKFGQSEYVIKLNLEKIKNISLNELIRLKINLTDVEYLLKTGVLREKEALLGYKLAFYENRVGEKLC